MDDAATPPATARPTLAAVAARAGVSVSTASLVFSGAGPVSDVRRERVLAAAAALDYAGPDPTARSLRRGRSGIIAVITEDSMAEAFRDPMNLALLDGIGAALSDERLGLLVIPLASEDGSVLTSAPMDAAILLGCSTDIRPTVAALHRRRIPIVAVEGAAMDDVVSIDLDNRAASARGAEHLRELGHTRVAVVTLPLDSARSRDQLTPEREAAATAHTTSERLVGVRSVFPGSGGVSAAGSTIDEGLAAARELLAGPADERPTAIIAQSDLLALGVLRAAEELGIAVPGELNVLGFDGIRLEGATAHVLTTLVQPAVEKGRAAAEAVLAALADGVGVGAVPGLASPPVDPLVLRSELRVGTTTGAPPRAGATPT